MMENEVEDIGTLLKNRREQLGHSLDDAAQHTRIRKTHLESIENNRYSDLPGQVYVTGFIKVYARYLGLDSNSVLSMLDDLPQEDGSHVVRPVVVTKPYSTRPRKPAKNSGWRFFVLGLIVVLLLGAAAYYLTDLLTDRDSSEPTVSQEVSPKESPQPQVAPTVNSVTMEQVESATTPETDSNPALAEPAAQVPNSLPIIPPGGGSLRMLAMAESSLVIYLDDREPHEYKLFDGLDLSWKVRQKVRIELAGPHVARFWMDGQELDLGDLESFELNQDAGE